jgi:hypothetical protein
MELNYRVYFPADYQLEKENLVLTGQEDREAQDPSFTVAQNFLIIVQTKGSRLIGLTFSVVYLRPKANAEFMSEVHAAIHVTNTSTHSSPQC